MKQTEFEDALRQMRLKNSAAMNQINAMQQEVKEEIASIGRIINEMQAKKKQLEVRRLGLAKCRDEESAKQKDTIRKFIEENRTEERKLSEVSDWCLVNELVARGFHGTIQNEGKPDDFMAVLKQRFSRDEYITPPNVQEFIEQQPNDAES